MTRPYLFSWWQRLALLLFLLAVAAQVWFWRGNASLRTSIPRATLAPEPKMRRPTFQTGVAFPQWGKDAYSARDRNWQIGLREIGAQTGARWISITLDFTQPSLSSTHLQAGPQVPLPQAFSEGIRLAREEGYSVFVQPLITVQGPQSWEGVIHFGSEREASAWFAAYWQVYQPYIVAAARAGANELALGTEFVQLQGWTNEWNRLIAQARAIFPGWLTYDMNWSSLGMANYPSWMQNPALAFVGVSTYVPLTDIPERIAPSALPALWRARIRVALDAFAAQIGKPVLISEIGYRDSPDALYNPYEPQRLRGTDPQEQAAAYDAALQNVLIDPHIAGVFFWAWSYPPFAPNGEPAANTLLHWYTSLLA